jgi:predicted amidohydrolase YtcJ
VVVGTDREVLALKGGQTKVINLNGRTAIPGLNDSHTHLIRSGLNYNLELRWDGVPSLADGLRMLREQARRDADWTMGSGGSARARTLPVGAVVVL